MIYEGVTYIVAYRFDGGVYYWSAIYGWTKQMEFAYHYERLEEAKAAAGPFGAFVLILRDGKVVE